MRYAIGLKSNKKKCNANLPKRAPEPYGYAGNDESWEVERNNSANVQFQDNDFVTQIFDDDKQAWKPEWYDDWEARFPKDTWRDISKLNEFVSWVKSTWRDEATNADLAEPVTYRLDTLATLTNYGSDDSYTVVDELSNGQKTGYSNITFTKDTPAYRLTKFRAEASQYMEIESATYYYLFTLFFLMIDSRAKNMFFGFHGGPADLQYIDRKTVFEPYDMDTAIGTNNSGVLKFGYYHLDTDTVSSIISGGDDGDSGKEAPVFNGQGSVLWSNFRDAFRSEYAAMYKSLRANGTWTYDRIEKMYEDHQSMWPEALFNEDAYVKYLVPLIENVTWDEDTGKYIKTDRYLTMLQGSKEQQRKWWLQNRFRYFDSMFTVGSADTSFIEMRLFNSGTLTVTPSQDLYVAARFGRGSTTQRVRATANTPVSFQYTVRQGMTVTEMESTIFSADLISDVGDLSVFYGNEFDFSRATKLRKLKLGDASPTYSNKNLNKLNVSNCYLLEEIDCRNCDELTQPINLDGSPMLEKAYFDGTKITSVSLVDGAPITTLHLPATITSLVLMNHNKLTDLTCPSYANVSTLMIANIDQSVIDPLALLPIIKKGSRVNIQGIDITVVVDQNDVVVEVPVYDENDNQTGTEQRTLTTNAEKAGYQIERFLDSLDEMTGVERVWATHVDGDGNVTEGWDYNDQDTAVVSGVIRTAELTGTQIASYNDRYPYLRILADHYVSKITFKTWDGSTTLSIIDCEDGSMKASAPTIPARTSTAQYDYTPVGWSRNQDAQTAQGDALTQIVADRVVYAAYSRTIRTYTVTWKNSNGTTLETDTGVPYGSKPSYNGTIPKDSDGYSATGWDKDIDEPITGNVTFTAIYKPVYTATFKLAAADGGTTLQTRKIQEGSTASYTGTTPTTSRGNTTEFTFIGWTPAFVPMYGDVTYTAVFRDNRSVVIKYLSNELDKFESTNLSVFTTDGLRNMTTLTSATAPATTVQAYAFRGCTNLTTVDLIATSGTVTIDANAFNGCTNLTSLIIRSNTMATLAATSALTGTKIATLYGAVYVPGALVDTYKANANWKNYIILPITEYPASGLDGTRLFDKSWDDIIGDTNYATNYAIGDVKKLNFGEYGDHLVELVAKDSDDKTVGGKARMTWICKDIITTHRMNASNTTAGGWESTEMRSWLNNTVLPTLPENVRNAIVEVNKVSSTYDSKIIVNGQTTADKLWIPSNHEVGFGTSYESTGPVYSVFNSNSARIKYRNGSTYFWWLRSAYNSAYFWNVYSDGSSGYSNASGARGVVPGFCI